VDAERGEAEGAEAVVDLGDAEGAEAAEGDVAAAFLLTPSAKPADWVCASFTAASGDSPAARS